MHERDLDGQAAVVRKILSYSRRIAIIGLSDRPARVSHDIGHRLMREGWEVVPVNPTIDTWYGLHAYPSVADVPGDIDLVNVFRRTEHLDGIADEVVARGGIRGLWLQQDLRSRHAKSVTAAAGIDYVEDRCIKVEIALHRDLLRLPPAA